MSQLTERKLFSISKFREANQDNRIDSANYLHALIAMMGMDYESLQAVIDCFIPSFSRFHDIICVESLWDEAKYQGLLAREIHSHEIEFWMNVTLFDDTFSTFPEDVQLELLEKARLGWSAALEASFPDEAVSVLKIVDWEAGDLGLSLSRKKP